MELVALGPIEWIKSPGGVRVGQLLHGLFVGENLGIEDVIIAWFAAV